MSRIEKGSGMEAQFDDLKSEVRRSNRGSSFGSWKIGCGVIILAGLLASIVWAVWIFAATGLLRVPLFTAWAYKTPEPIHAVQPGLSMQDYLATDPFQNGTWPIPEGVLTTSLRASLQATSGTSLDLDRAQVAVDPAVGLELFLPFKDNELESALRLQITVGVEDGQPVPTHLDAWVGNWHVPSLLTRMTVESALRQALVQWRTELGGPAIQSIEYHDGVVSITTL